MSKPSEFFTVVSVETCKGMREAEWGFRWNLCFPASSRKFNLMSPKAETGSFVSLPGTVIGSESPWGESGWKVYHPAPPSKEALNTQGNFQNQLQSAWAATHTAPCEWDSWGKLCLKILRLGLLWWSSGYDSTLPMQGGQVWPLVSKLDPTWHN